ncbi:MAG: VOC family protein [Cytophagales bacterium]|nr:VOC family protein [Cytophagales bacterium]
MQKIGMISLLVREYDEALTFYRDVLGFVLIEDTVLTPAKRWVVVAPAGDAGCRLLLAKAATEEQQKFVGNQTGGRVFLFMYTDDFWRYYQNLVSKNVKFVREPVNESYGTVAVFEDLYGNQWDLIERK